MDTLIGRAQRASRRAGGAVLITGLVLLVAMTVIGVTAMQTTVLEERMAGNLRDRNVAFQAAEAGLQAGLSFLQTPVPPSIGDTRLWSACTVGQDLANPGPRTACLVPVALANWQDLDRVPSEGVTYAEFNGGLQGEEAFGDAALPPRIIVAENYVPGAGAGDDVSFRGQAASGVRARFTVTALGFGTNARTRVILQSTVVRIY
jgi:type IV pilus assembly protein PilX